MPGRAYFSEGCGAIEIFAVFDLDLRVDLLAEYISSLSIRVLVKVESNPYPSPTFFISQFSVGEHVVDLLGKIDETDPYDPL